MTKNTRSSLCTREWKDGMVCFRKSENGISSLSLCLRKWKGEIGKVHTEATTDIYVSFVKLCPAGFKNKSEGNVVIPTGIMVDANKTESLMVILTFIMFSIYTLLKDKFMPC
ncbi:uncharacterized protein EV154DRAFT_483009 [Mucor mucedo]|uniref:uncharacterized protein n=1 Tax=Mucor mucedo TaxID=29922 RepID=UPI00221E7ED6|nr:uncharacterized protein EV154DRAFT_483009 [Mucor mucedo]KAI7889569.1 hypothetical protein EV154DRAFT_483009 [Mucor mucedo]